MARGCFDRDGHTLDTRAPRKKDRGKNDIDLVDQVLIRLQDKKP